MTSVCLFCRGPLCSHVPLRSIVLLFLFACFLIWSSCWTATETGVVVRSPGAILAVLAPVHSVPGGFLAYSRFLLPLACARLRHQQTNTMYFSSCHLPTDCEILIQDKDIPTLSPKVLCSENGCRVTRFGYEWMPTRRRGILDGDTNNVPANFYARKETRLDGPTSGCVPCSQIHCSKFTWQHAPATIELTPGLPHKARCLLDR